MAATHEYKPRFDEKVVEIMKKLYPEELADKSWDNTGLLLDRAALTDFSRSGPTPAVLLTNDLSTAVVDEAMQEGVDVIICYHPVIFKPLKSLTNVDPMQTQLLRLVAKGVVVYCPHTAVDAAVGGLNDWLCDILVDSDQEIKRTVVEPISRPLPSALQGQEVGYGRALELSQPITIPTLLKRLSVGIGGQRYMMVALPPGVTQLPVRQRIDKVAVCAGSGADVLKDTDAQVIVTGEMAHHYALRHTQRGQIVVTVFHSNSERKFLEQRLKPQLEAEIQRSDYSGARVIVSRWDSDPFRIIDVENLA
ncbi:NGG1p interacting factor 3 [Poronia punctata]|nr:NGG1p interacting factor 3 [Poronia punctata]